MKKGLIVGGAVIMLGVLILIANFSEYGRDNDIVGKPIYSESIFSEYEGSVTGFDDISDTSSILNSVYSRETSSKTDDISIGETSSKSDDISASETSSKTNDTSPEESRVQSDKSSGNNNAGFSYYIVFNTKSKKYHTGRCPGVEKMLPENRYDYPVGVPGGTQEDHAYAEAQGYVLCKNCEKGSYEPITD